MAPTLTIERAALLPALSAVLKAVETRNTIPILGNLLLTAGDDALTIAGTDLDIQVEATVPAAVEARGTITVPAQAFHDLVRKGPEKAKFRLAPGAAPGSFTINAGRARATVPTLPAEDFPLLVDLKNASYAYTLDLEGATLAGMIGRCDFAISTEETRYYLQGIYCHAVEVDGAPMLRLVATDGHRLARISTGAVGGLDAAMPGVIIPRKACGLIKGLAENADSERLRIDIARNAIRVEAASATITSKLIDGTFPDYARVIPIGGDREARVPAKAMGKILDFVATMGLDKIRSVKLDFEADLLSVSLRNTEGGDTCDELEIELQGAPITAGFNARYLAEILDKSGGDTARLRLGPDASSPILIGDRLDEALFVLMPMRI